MGAEAAETPRATPQVSKGLNTVLWILQVLAAALFLFSAYAKWTSVPVVVEAFGKIGLGQWFRYFTGCVELCGAILLLIPRGARWGGALLAVTMFCAVLAHLFRLGGSPVGAIVLLVVTAFIAWKRG